MRTFRYQLSGSWFKGNTHIHSTASDGGKSFSELAGMYAKAGFHFLFRTDHWVASDVSADKKKYPLAFFDGIELNGRDSRGSEYHVVCLGTFEEISEKAGFDASLDTVRGQNGLLILAHPHWMGNNFEEANRHEFDGVEVYNHVCYWMNGKGNGAPFLDAMLLRNPETLCFASDDAHIIPEHPGWNGGWIMVNARELTQEAVIAAIRAGNFYSTTGPEIRNLSNNKYKVTIECSPAKFIWLAGPSWRGMRMLAEEGKNLTTASFEIPLDWEFAYYIIEDAEGHRAWTNNLFTLER